MFVYIHYVCRYERLYVCMYLFFLSVFLSSLCYVLICFHYFYVLTDSVSQIIPVFSPASGHVPPKKATLGLFKVNPLLNDLIVLPADPWVDEGAAVEAVVPVDPGGVSSSAGLSVAAVNVRVVLSTVGVGGCPRRQSTFLGQSHMFRGALYIRPEGQAIE